MVKAATEVSHGQMEVQDINGDPPKTNSSWWSEQLGLWREKAQDSEGLPDMF